MGCAKSKPEVAPEERPVLDADEEERKQRLESAVLARREADAHGQDAKQRTGDPSALLPAQEGVVMAPVEATLQNVAGGSAGDGPDDADEAVAPLAAQSRQTADPSAPLQAHHFHGHLADALARGAAPALKKLYLNNNKLGDEGARHLADALARGAAPALKTLWLNLNPVSDAAKQALRDARPGLQIKI